MNRLRLRGSSFVAAIAIALVASSGVLGVWPGPSRIARAGDGVTALAIDGWIGEPVSQGRTFVLHGSDAVSVSATADPSGSHVAIEFVPPPSGGPAGADPWTLDFFAPSGQALAVGDYFDAAKGPPGGAGPGMFVAGNGVGISSGSCDPYAASFRVHAVDLDGQAVRAFSASFWQRCAENPGGMYGEVRFRATQGIKWVSTTPKSIDFGRLDTGIWSSMREITVVAEGTQPTTLGTAWLDDQDGGTFRIDVNTCDGATLAVGERCLIGVSARPYTNRVVAGGLQIGDETVRGARNVPFTAEGVGDVQGTARVEPHVIYPIVDAFGDTISITGTRDEPASVHVDLHDLTWTGGSIQRQLDLPTGLGAYEITWNGWWSDGGWMAQEGEVDVEVTLTDEAGNRRSFTERVTVSWDWVDWETRRLTKDPWKLSLWGWTRDARISLVRSSARSWVRLASNRGFAAVIYEFPVVPAEHYQQMRFEVLGRSIDRHKAVIATWNPALGGYRYLDNYDAARKIGPGQQWWRTETLAAGRVRKGRTYAAVQVWNGLGGPGRSTFEVGQVRLVYTYGTYHTTGFPSSVDTTGEVQPSDRHARRSLASLTGEVGLPGLEPFIGWPMEADPLLAPPPRSRPADLVKHPPHDGPTPVPSQPPVALPPGEDPATPSPVPDPGLPEATARPSSS